MARIGFAKESIRIGQNVRFSKYDHNISGAGISIAPATQKANYPLLKPRGNLTNLTSIYLIKFIGYFYDFVLK